MGVYHVQAPAPRGEKRTRCGRRIVWFQGLMVIKPADWERGRSIGVMRPCKRCESVKEWWPENWTVED